jgi:hypothetical protein
MEKTIKNGMVEKIVFSHGYNDDKGLPKNSARLAVSSNDMRGEIDDDKEAIDLYKKCPLYLWIHQEGEMDLDIFLSREDVEELHRYIGEILEITKNL